MSEFIIRPSKLKGEIIIPPSKSHTLRSVLFGSLGSGKSVIYDYLHSPDTDAMIQACRYFGASVDVFPDRLEIEGISGRIFHTEDVINAGNSGIVLRFCTAIGALANHPVVVTGDDSIRHQRPMKPLLEGLSQLGASAVSMRGDDFAPVIIQGPLKAGTVIIDGSDSQYVSALLIAATFADGPIEIEVKNPGEIPWVALTLNWFDRLGIPYRNDQFERFYLPGNVCHNGFTYHVPGDFSSAAYPIAAALITQSEISLKNIDIHDVQGDKELISVFQKMGALIEVDEEKHEIHVKKGGKLQGVSVDINNFIDAITILAVVGCFATGETHVYNGAVARQKECNRIACIASELRKMGAKITETEDGLIVKQSALTGAFLNSHFDQRMAMSLAIAALGAEGEVKISNVECVSKTFPNFKQAFNKLGSYII